VASKICRIHNKKGCLSLSCTPRLIGAYTKKGKILVFPFSSLHMCVCTSGRVKFCTGSFVVAWHRIYTDRDKTRSIYLPKTNAQIM
jgi:hypothetical protein